MLTLAELTAKADAMRQCPTFSEGRAYDSLLGGPAFENQVVFGFYILDFVIPSKLLIIEIDGESHLAQREHDQKRDAFCVALGLKVLRIPNRLANTAAYEASLYPDVEGYARKWEKAQRTAARKQARIETKHATPTRVRKQRLAADKAATEAKRVQRIQAVQALPADASFKEVRAALDFAAPSRGCKKKKTPENREARIAAGIARQAEKKAKRAAKLKANPKPRFVKPYGTLTTLTKTQVEAGRTENGGFTREQLASWGVPWPPPKGWKKRLTEQP
ncbi:endonuclease domain-containing protein [Hymenobacter koreensis]